MVCTTKFSHLACRLFNRGRESNKTRQPIVKVEQTVDEWYGLYHAPLFSFNPRLYHLEYRKDGSEEWDSSPSKIECCGANECAGIVESTSGKRRLLDICPHYVAVSEGEEVDGDLSRCDACGGDRWYVKRIGAAAGSFSKKVRVYLLRIYLLKFSHGLFDSLFVVAVK